MTKRVKERGGREWRWWWSASVWEMKIEGERERNNERRRKMLLLSER